MARDDSGDLSSPPIIGGYSILGGLPHASLARLLREAKQQQLRRGEILFSRGNEGDEAIYVRQGIIKLSVVSPLGEQRTYALHGPGEAVGEISMIDGLPRASTAEALTDCHVSVISKATFDAELLAHPDIYRHVVAMLARRIRIFGEEMMGHGFLPMKARLARALLRAAQLMGERSGVDLLGIGPNISHGDIASMAGVTRESVSRVLAEWRSAGIVSASDRHRLVLNVRKLAEEAVRHE